MTDLVAYLRAAAGTPFVWGSTDCSLFMADWVRAARGIDPAAPLRGRYHTARGAARHVHRHGGMEAMGRSLAEASGLAVTEAPRPGDIGLVRDPVAGPLFAICTAIGWVSRAPRGLACGAFPLVVAWSV